MCGLIILIMEGVLNNNNYNTINEYISILTKEENY